MLSEIKNVRQIENEGKRRWFRDDVLDLIVWYKSDESVDGFQLCYGKTTRKHVLTWRFPNRYEHHSIDEGERIKGRSKMSPILEADGAFDLSSIGAVLAARSTQLPNDIVALVADVISRYDLPDAAP